MGEYEVWAPNANQVDLLLLEDQEVAERLPMLRSARGRFHVVHERVRAGQCYAFSLDQGPPLPDPRSQLQPQGVHGPSCWVDLDDFPWTDADFNQVPLASAVIYELHVGTFREAGTFDSVVEDLPRLKRLGVTHVELMPVAHFPGERGWGYDGVHLFAPHTVYGGPRGLQRLVNACHEAGLAVLLDVVYNHLGPSGNYLARYGPYFTSSHNTPWGEAVNFDRAESDEVRRFVIDNALHWLSHYHIDGLRLDAIHAIFDQSADHILTQLAQEVDVLSAHLGRRLVVTAESDLNDGRIVRPAEVGGYGLDSQWSDDFHHSLHALLTKERAGYYADYGSLARLVDCLRHGFAFRGQYAEYRRKAFGGDTSGLRGRHFIVFSQNHDQIGNRAVGDRLAASLAVDALKLEAALVLLSPFVPLLFMGQEWGSRTPFQYFTDHSEPELARAVREGRRRELAAFGWAPDEIPDPQSGETFVGSKLDWDAREQQPHAQLEGWYQDLLHLRHRLSEFGDDRLTALQLQFDEARRWLWMRRGTVSVLFNFSDQSCELGPLPERQGVLLRSSPGLALSGKSLRLPPASVGIVGPERYVGMQRR
jgi:maltooligosyltrehalose trehalohydrolase